ncbi:MAG: hypothetical protein H3C50_08075 [Kiritimatiellae bacterium]|nr:hypothetical protein [Kiritimatiellia bacterium]MCO5068475.1 hypothetical protein [Kiritimatiellia bacterium]
MNLAYYITAHGYGHGARSCDILRALRERAPKAPIHVVTDLPRDFLAARLPPGPWHFRAGRFDVGMAQLDSIRVDIPATLRGCQALLNRADVLRQQELAFLERHEIAAVVCDIPAIPIQAARACGIPVLAVGNFAWDWIYDEFAAGDSAWQPIVRAFREGYAECDLLLRLPFAEPMAAFPRRVELGVPARPGVARRAELAAATGADPAKRWVLLSFTTLDWDDAALDRVRALREWEFFTVEPLRWNGPNFRAVQRSAFSYSDVLASCDAVLTKPGFGVLAECAVNDKPMIYVERTDFREYPVLEAAVKRHFRSVHLPSEDLYRGDLRAALEAIETASPAREAVRAGGDAEAAELILQAARDQG